MVGYLQIEVHWFLSKTCNTDCVDYESVGFCSEPTVSELSGFIDHWNEFEPQHNNTPHYRDAQIAFYVIRIHM